MVCCKVAVLKKPHGNTDYYKEIKDIIALVLFSAGVSWIKFSSDDTRTKTDPQGENNTSLMAVASKDSGPECNITAAFLCYEPKGQLSCRTTLSTPAKKA